jgi:hypothetical protein
MPLTLIIAVNAILDAPIRVVSYPCHCKVLIPLATINKQRWPATAAAQVGLKDRELEMFSAIAINGSYGIAHDGRIRAGSNSRASDSGRLSCQRLRN